MSEPVTERQFYILTAHQIGGQFVAFPRPACLTLWRNGKGEMVLDENGCTFDAHFCRAAQTVWERVRALLPDESEGWSLHLAVKAQGAISGGSAGLPLTLVLLSALLEEPLPEALCGTGLLCLAAGWFAGRFLEGMEAKAQALVPLSRRQQGPITLAIPYHRSMCLPDPAPEVRYLRLAHVAHAAAELFPHRAERVRERFQALSTLEQLPFELAVKEAFRQNKAQTIILERVGPAEKREIKISQEAWGTAVWVRLPSPQDGGTVVCRFEGEKLLDREYFANLPEVRAFGDILSNPAPGGTLGILETSDRQIR